MSYLCSLCCLVMHNLTLKSLILLGHLTALSSTCHLAYSRFPESPRKFVSLRSLSSGCVTLYSPSTITIKMSICHNGNLKTRSS